MRVTIFAQVRLNADLLKCCVERSGHTVDHTTHTLEVLDFRSTPDFVIVTIPDDRQDCQVLVDRLAACTAPVLAICPAERVTCVRKFFGDTLSAIHPDTHSLELLMSSITLLENGYSVSFAPGEPPAAVRPVQKVTHIMPSEPVVSDNNPNLSSREMHVLAKIREGYSNKEIANQLNISDSTVKVHVRSILRKANVKNRTQAALWAEDYLRDNWLTS